MSAKGRPEREPLPPGGTARSAEGAHIRAKGRPEREPLPPGGRAHSAEGASRRPAAPRLRLAVQYGVGQDSLPRPPTLRRWARAALDRDATLTLRFVGRREGERLNALYRGRKYPTNVLAFVYDATPAVHGDVVLCAPVLRQEARAQRKSLADHCAHLVVHGVLHLLGYDHATDSGARTMEARETAILASLGVSDPYAGRDAGRRYR